MPKFFNYKNVELAEIPARLDFYRLITTKNISAGSKQLKFDIRKLEPGRFSFAYHYHHNCEEFFFIISGKGMLRSPEGFREVNEGDMIFMEEGPTSAHQLYNHSDAPMVYLDIRTTPPADIVEYPDTGKILILPAFKAFPKEAAVDYYQGEENLKEHWPEEIVGR